MSIHSLSWLTSMICCRMLSTSGVSMLMPVKSSWGRRVARSTTTLFLIRRRHSWNVLSAKHLISQESEMYILFKLFLKYSLVRKVSGDVWLRIAFNTHLLSPSLDRNQLGLSIFLLVLLCSGCSPTLRTKALWPNLAHSPETGVRLQEELELCRRNCTLRFVTLQS